MTAQPDFWHQLPVYLGEGLILTLWYGFLQGLQVLCFPGRAGRILLDGVFAFSAILLFFSPGPVERGGENPRLAGFPRAGGLPGGAPSGD